QICQ
ncbi:phosphotransferase enzyme family protein, partial [Vibrio parahaemolyticus V-223/04]